MARVLLKDLNKKFDGTHAVKNVNLEIRDHEFVVLVGPSGCGKTTTLRMVAGLEDITSGEVSIDGKVVNNLAPMDRDIAMVFQNYALYPHMSVYDNMAFGLRMRKFDKPEIDRRVRHAADVLGIQPLRERTTGQLSDRRRPARALPAPREPLRRRLYRLAGHELHPRHDHGERRCTVGGSTRAARARAAAEDAGPAPLQRPARHPRAASRDAASGEP